MIYRYQTNARTGIESLDTISAHDTERLLRAITQDALHLSYAEPPQCSPGLSLDCGVLPPTGGKFYVRYQAKGPVKNHVFEQLVIFVGYYYTTGENTFPYCYIAGENAFSAYQLPTDAPHKLIERNRFRGCLITATGLYWKLSKEALDLLMDRSEEDFLAMMVWALEGESIEDLVAV